MPGDKEPKWPMNPEPTIKVGDHVKVTDAGESMVGHVSDTGVVVEIITSGTPPYGLKLDDGNQVRAWVKAVELLPAAMNGCEHCIHCPPNAKVGDGCPIYLKIGKIGEKPSGKDCQSFVAKTCQNCGQQPVQAALCPVEMNCAEYVNNEGKPCPQWGHKDAMCNHAKHLWKPVATFKDEIVAAVNKLPEPAKIGDDFTHGPMGKVERKPGAAGNEAPLPNLEDCPVFKECWRLAELQKQLDAALLHKCVGIDKCDAVQKVKAELAALQQNNVQRTAYDADVRFLKGKVAAAEALKDKYLS
jgi:hypothetical protein